MAIPIIAISQLPPKPDGLSIAGALIPTTIGVITYHTTAEQFFSGGGTRVVLSDVVGDAQSTVEAAWNAQADASAIVRAPGEIVFYRWPSAGPGIYRYMGSQSVGPWTTTAGDWLNATVVTSHDALAGLTADDHLQYLPLTGVRDMTGPLTLSGAPLLPLHAATKGYVDGAVSVIVHGSLGGLSADDHLQYLPLSGVRAMTGALTLPGAPTIPLHAATKGYVDAQIGAIGPSLPPGGTSGEVLTKLSGVDGDADWEPSAAGVGTVAVADTMPTLAPGEQWFESDAGGMYLKYQNPDSTTTLVGINTPAPEGPPGPQGIQGDPGASTSVFNYRSLTTTYGISDPGSGKFKWNNANQLLATEIVFDWITEDGFDAHVLFQQMNAPQRFTIQDKDFALVYQTWNLVSVNEYSDFFGVVVTLDSYGGSGLMANNKSCSVLVIAEGSPGPMGPPGTTAYVVQNFSGDGATVAFTLSADPGTENNCQVYIDGVYQQKNTFSVSGTTLTFSTAPPTGTNNVEVVLGATTAAVLADGSVTTPKLADGAVTTPKIADANVTPAKLSAALLAALVPPGVVLDFAGAAAPTGFLPCDGAAVSRTIYALLFAAIGTVWGAGNGSTTFNVPDFRRRVAVGAGGTPLTGMGYAVGDVGGNETVALSIAELPSHDHSAVTGLQNNNHTHSGTTGVENANHAHSGTTGGMNSNTSHTHQIDGGLVFNTSGSGGTGLAASGGGTPQSPSSGLIQATNIDHTHPFTSGLESTTHGHAFTTATESGNHGHAITAQGSGTAHNNMQPSAVVLKIIRTGL